MKHQVGQTRDVGFQFGVRRSFPISNEKAWDFLFSQRGLGIWLGDLETEVKLNAEFKTKDGINGFVRIFKPHSHIRMNWKREHWENLSTVQVRVIEQKNKSTISFHQEKLLDSKQREEMKDYWGEIMGKISSELSNEVSR